MTSPSQLRARVLGIVATAIAAAGLGSCYKPSITNGGVACNTEYDEQYQCPSGYSCHAGRCWQNGTYDAGASDVPIESKPDAPIDAPADGPVDKMDAPTEAPLVCITPPSSCTATAPAGMCDLFCQTGCPRCDEKCSVDTKGDRTCNAMTTGALVRQIGDSCTPVSQGTTDQTDNCAPGLVCLSGTCGSNCYKFCRENTDCPSSECSRTLTGTTIKYCDVPAVTCNPVSALGATGCPAAGLGCYLSATVADETRCDCSFNSLHEGDDCSVSRDCLPGLMCADISGTNHPVCTRACKLGVTPNGCANSGNCNPIAGSKTFGFCN